MEDTNALMIMGAIGDARTALTRDLGILSATVEKYHANLDARVGEVETSARSQKRQQFVVTYIVLPVMSLGHAIAAHFGVKV